jgi:hypothetical protein
MGVFFFKLQKGTFKVHSTKKREERPRHPSSRLKVLFVEWL